MAIASYPHVEMHVRDDSIFIPSQSEFLPLNKPLYMMRCQRGPVGVPVWCATYSDAVRVFGADTFNKRAKYFSEDAYFLTKTFPYNGAFIMRVASDTAVNARVSIEIGLSKELQAIPQYKRDVNGNFELELDGSKIPISGSDAYKGMTAEEIRDSLTPEEIKDKTEQEIETLVAEKFGVQATVPGYKVAWRGAIRTDEELKSRPLGWDGSVATENFTWFPLVDVEATNPGAWGEFYGIKLYFDQQVNTLSGIITNGAATYSLSPIEVLQDATVPSAVVDAFGQSTVTGVIKPDVVDEETELDLSLDKRVKRAYSGKQALPLSFYYIQNNWNVVGTMLMKQELEIRQAAYAFYKDAGLEYVLIEEGATPEENVYGVKTFVDDLVPGKDGKATTKADVEALPECGYMANIASFRDSNGVPMFSVYACDKTDPFVTSDSRLIPTDVIIPSSDTPIKLGGGLDGPIEDWNIEEYMRAEIRAAQAGVQDYLVDYWRCPFNVMYDTGWSLKTKKAVLDFTGVRDDLVAVIGTQITWKTPKTVSTVVTPNSRMDDESIGALLRAYALLMKEDTENGTTACRAKIFCHAGKTSDHDDKWLPYTLWMALKNAEYLNKDYIWQEAKELPFSSVECFTETSWTAASEDTKSRVWNAGLNYVQFYDMTHIHFASVRSVYSYETSILVDAGVVDALTFMKHITRRSWSTWAGSTRKAAELNQCITADLNSRLSYMLHGKFEHNVNVYQTTEDMNLGYARHVDLELIAPGQNRAWKATIICKRENYNPEAVQQ